MCSNEEKLDVKSQL